MVLMCAEGQYFFILWTVRREVAYYLCISVFVGLTVVLRRWWWVPMLPLTAWIIHTGVYCSIGTRSSFVAHFPEFLSGSIDAVIFNRLSTWAKTTSFTFTWRRRLLDCTLEAIVLLLALQQTVRRIPVRPQEARAVPVSHRQEPPLCASPRHTAPRAFAQADRVCARVVAASVRRQSELFDVLAASANHLPGFRPCAGPQLFHQGAHPLALGVLLEHAQLPRDQSAAVAFLPVPHEQP